VIIEILKPQKVLVFIEGKMFENLAQPKLYRRLAERVGFEPTSELPQNRFSRPAP
jgi:hypothetical protein